MLFVTPLVMFKMFMRYLLIICFLAENEAVEVVHQLASTLPQVTYSNINTFILRKKMKHATYAVVRKLFLFEDDLPGDRNLRVSSVKNKSLNSTNRKRKKNTKITYQNRLIPLI